MELGLLGSQLTAHRRAAAEAPFAPVADPAQPGVTYFAPTGHTLRGAFRRYWAAHGGLALYGYPLSEEFAEVNPADGQTYTVQYFERARFEYHPEYAGTPFEVELGLLGNTAFARQGLAISRRGLLTKHKSSRILTEILSEEGQGGGPPPWPSSPFYRVWEKKRSGPRSGPPGFFSQIWAYFTVFVRLISHSGIYVFVVRTGS